MGDTDPRNASRDDIAAGAPIDVAATRATIARLRVDTAKR
jgi:hypothetical protein